MINNRRIIHALTLISLLFLGLIIYLSYFELFTKDKIINNPYNRRLRETEEKVVRGTIYDRNNIVLANSVISGTEQERRYPFNALYCHIIGYSSQTYGKSLIEAKLNDFLLGKNDLNTIFDLKNKITGTVQTGNNIFLTIDHNLQLATNELLAGKKGAAVAINPKTGEILAMVSKPDFNANDSVLRQNWTKLVESEDHSFLPRATLGLYAPGSTYKVLISGTALEKGLGGKTFDDNGKITIDGKVISNFGGEAHGKLNLKEALTLSSNSFFASLGLSLGENNLKELSQKAEFNQDIPFDIPISQSEFPYKTMSKADMAISSIGQGKVLVNPLHMALIASTIANKGIMMKPILVNKIQNNDKVVIKSQKLGILSTVFTPQIASAVAEMMLEVVNNGTGQNAQISGLKVAGKTGTAENELSSKDSKKDHAWFIGFAPADKPQIAVAVILEYSGSTGGEIAAPIARDIMNKWINELNN